MFLSFQCCQERDCGSKKAGRKQEESCQEAEMDVGKVNRAGQAEDTRQQYISVLLFETKQK